MQLLSCCRTNSAMAPRSMVSPEMPPRDDRRGRSGSGAAEAVDCASAPSRSLLISDCAAEMGPSRSLLISDCAAEMGLSSSMDSSSAAPPVYNRTPHVHRESRRKC